MTRSKRMTPVAKIADNKERNAAKVFGKSQQDLKDHEDRLQELIKYRDEYNAKFIETGSNGLEAQKVHAYRIFLNRLNDAIDHQRNIVQQATGELLKEKENWMHTRSRAKALEKVVERYQDQEEKELQRQEQKESDERASRSTPALHEK